MSAKHRRAPTLTPHEMEEDREEFLKGVIVDHLDGVVGEAEVEKANAQRRDPLEPNWSLDQSSGLGVLSQRDEQLPRGWE